jgi:hypothetical protein
MAQRSALECLQHIASAHSGNDVSVIRGELNNSSWNATDQDNLSNA